MIFKKLLWKCNIHAGKYTYLKCTQHSRYSAPRLRNQLPAPGKHTLPALSKASCCPGFYLHGQVLPVLTLSGCHLCLRLVTLLTLQCRVQENTALTCKALLPGRLLSFRGFMPRKVSGVSFGGHVRAQGTHPHVSASFGLEGCTHRCGPKCPLSARAYQRAAPVSASSSSPCQSSMLHSFCFSFSPFQRVGNSDMWCFKSAISQITNKINVPSQMFIGHLDSLSCEMAVQVLCPFSIFFLLICRCLVWIRGQQLRPAGQTQSGNSLTGTQTCSSVLPYGVHAAMARLSFREGKQAPHQKPLFANRSSTFSSAVMCMNSSTFSPLWSACSLSQRCLF